MVSSISRLLCVLEDAPNPPAPLSNVCATDESVERSRRRSPLVACLVAIAVHASTATAQAQQQEPRRDTNRAVELSSFLAGAAVGLVAHEGGHLLFDVIFDADPGVKRVEFHGIPFFAISHDEGLSPRKEFVISSAGFWVQHATNEWLLTKRPHLRSERAPFAKGMFAFNVGASAAYSVAAFAQTGPVERDTYGMAVSARIDEPWIGALILAPAVLDTWRYLDPDARWPVWLSRAFKVGAVLLVLR
jgi:hypothetical protein